MSRFCLKHLSDTGEIHAPLRLVAGLDCARTLSVKLKFIACLGLMSSALAAFGQSSAFTYQGQLTSAGSPATGQFEFRFTLHDALTLGNQVGSTLTNTSVGVTNGLFATTMNFGSGAFDGNARWLEIGVRTNASTNEFNQLVPRQAINATPYAVRAANYSGLVATTNFTGKINDTNLSANVALLTNNAVFTRSVTATNFIGNALGLTNVQATNISGTVPDLRLSTNVAFVNTSNTVFLGAITATNFYGQGFGLTNVPGRIFEVIPIGSAFQAFPNYGYLATNNSTPVVLTLPSTASIKPGETIRITGIGTAGWVIAQNTNQTILTANLIKNVGFSWRTNLLNVNWKAIGSAQDGQRMVAVINGGFTYYTTNAGVSWTAGGTSASWSSVAGSADGSNWIAGANSGFLHTSANGGASWTQRGNSLAWSGVASSWDGAKLAAVVNGGNPWTSVNSGVGWTERSTGAARSWTGIASSGDGVYLAACASGSQIYTSTNSGVNWAARDTARAWSCIASSADGATLIAGVNSGTLYVSYDFGTTWASTGPSSPATWASVACSGDGSRMIASISGASGEVYVSQDSGATWQKRSNLPTPSFTGVTCSGDGGTMAVVGSASGIYYSSQVSTTPGAAGQLIGSRLAAVELMHAGNGVFIPVSHEGNIRAK